MDEKQKEIVQLVDRFNLIRGKINSFDTFDELSKVMEDILSFVVKNGYPIGQAKTFKDTMAESRVKMLDTIDGYCNWLKGNITDMVEQLKNE